MEKKNKVLNKKINSKIKVTMVHGEKDEVVPVSYSKKILKLFPKSKTKFRVIVFSKSGGIDDVIESQKKFKIIPY